MMETIIRIAQMNSISRFTVNENPLIEIVQKMMGNLCEMIDF